MRHINIKMITRRRTKTKKKQNILIILLNNNKTLNNVITSFFEVAENRSFDYRQTLKIMHKQPNTNKDIVILAIDDASLEFLWDKYGDWPIPRYVFANVIKKNSNFVFLMST